MRIETPATHRNDPETSHIAEQSMNKSGKRHSQQEQVLELVRKYPGMTSAELARMSGLDRAMIARRLPELADHEIMRGIQVRCSVNGTLAVTWYPRWIFEEQVL